MISLQFSQAGFEVGRRQIPANRTLLNYIRGKKLSANRASAAGARID